MCGICGIWSPETTGAGERIDGMLDSIVHRGPDGVGRLDRPGVALGMRRLAIIDLAGRGPADRQRGRHGRRSSSTARSTTSASCAPSSSGRATASTRRTPRSSSTRYEESGDGVRRPARAGCSRSRSGTSDAGGSCSRATASARSRSTTRATAAAGVRLARSRRCCAPACRSELDADRARRVPGAALRAGAADALRGRAASSHPAHRLVVGEDGRRGSSATGAATTPEARDDARPRPPRCSRHHA